MKKLKSKTEIAGPEALPSFLSPADHKPLTGGKEVMLVLSSAGPDSHPELFEDEVRSEEEIQAAIDVVYHQLWYERNRTRALCVALDERLLSAKECAQLLSQGGDWVDLSPVPEPTRIAAQRTEKMLGKGNYGPFSDFDRGMLNGKLSALRWVLGEDWDVLDT